MYKYFDYFLTKQSTGIEIIGESTSIIIPVVSMTTSEVAYCNSITNPPRSCDSSYMQRGIEEYTENRIVNGEMSDSRMFPS